MPSRQSSQGKPAGLSGPRSAQKKLPTDYEAHADTADKCLYVPAVAQEQCSGLVELATHGSLPNTRAFKGGPGP
jgi:hypothetical protein